MSGASVGISQPMPCSGRNPLRRCRNNRGKENIVVIDVDSDNVIVIDVTESSSTNLQGSTVLRKESKRPFQWGSIICLDDEENSDCNFSSSGLKIDSILKNGGSSSMRPCSISGNFVNSLGTAEDECQFVQENTSPVKLSKCKRTYSGKASHTNWYGLNIESGSSSGNDYQDCMLMEDFSGKFREQWEKASSKRKCDLRSGKSCFREPRTDFSADHANGHLRAESGLPKEASPEGKDCGQKQGPSSSISKGTNLWLASDPENGTSDEADDYHLGTILKTPFCSDKGKSFGNPPSEHAECHIGQSFEQGGSSYYHKGKQGHAVPSSFPCNEPGMSQAASEQTSSLKSDGRIIFEREKLKETDEYKKAMEEEWASRQRALQIQAEEAQEMRRQRKRRNAESLRLLDMERRQKQRLEEIRETQKKDEENLNLKEVIRTEVRKDLSKMEVTCYDMASVLRGLGIPVRGGLHPSLDEVRSAYKRALLTFHPDRAPKSDIRQQVEAEEKFKLISRMKDKYLAT